jgi:CRISPR-associated endonuclease Csn1
LELNKDKLHANTKQEIEVGKITNPSVHITLNELRKIVNLLLEKYGKILNNHQFDNIHIELSRDLCLGQKSVDDIIRKQNKNETINQKYKDELLKLGIMPNKESMLKLSLFKYLEAVGIKQCIYTGNPLPASSQELFNNSADWEIDHILPYSRSFDDSRMNKILIHRIANQAKGERTPWEYVSQYFTPTEQQEFRKFILSKFPDEEKGGKIIKRGRHWVFLEEGTEYLKNNPNAKKHERLMNDTRYMTRVARMYLQALYNKYDDSIERKEQRNNKVVAIPSGKITAHMRREWHLDNLLWTDEQKEVRKDIKIQLQNYKDSYDNNQLSDELLRKYDMLSDLKNCCIDRKTYEYFNELMDKSISEGLSEKDVAEANDKFNKAKAKLKNRNDHRHHALDAVVIALADISMVQNAGKTSKQNEYLNKNEKEKIIQKDAPPTLREHLKQRIAKINVSHKPDHATAGVMHKETAMNIINTYGDKCSVKANKEIIKNITQKSLLGIKDKTGRIYKYYATESNYCYEIYINEKGKIDGDIISTYTTNQKAYQQYMQDKELFNSKTFNNGNPHEGKKLLMRLIMGDMLQIEDSGIKRLVYIQKMTEGQIVFNEHFEANCNARYLAGLQGTSFIAKGKSPSKFKEWNAQKVVVTPIGQVKPLKKIKY